MMIRGRYVEPVNPYADTIRRLEEELYSARRAIIGLMPSDVQKFLTDYYSCESREDTYRWEHDTVETILSLATVIPKDLPTQYEAYFSDRAYCPLCRAGSSSPYTSGFTLPEGLRRHLVGFGNVHQCDVMHAVMANAHAHWRRKFQPAEDAAEMRKRQEKAARKATETLYRISPHREPELIDEIFWKDARDEAGLAWAEERLAALGFRIVLEGRVKSYVDNGNRYVVYADPRAKGHIAFHVYASLEESQGRASRTRGQPTRSFDLMDTWKHDLRGKYQVRLASALETQ